MYAIRSYYDAAPIHDEVLEAALRTAGANVRAGIGGVAFGFGLWNYFYVLYETGAAS